MVTTNLVVLKRGEKQELQLKLGTHRFKVVLPEFFNKVGVVVTIVKCIKGINTECKPIEYDMLELGSIEFEDTINNLYQHIYQIHTHDGLYAQFIVYPIAIDVDEIMKKTASYIETLLTLIPFKIR